MTLEDIGEDDTALLCKTNLTACCRHPYTTENKSALGKWLFPNGTTVSSGDEEPASYNNSTDFYRNRDKMVVRLNRRRGGEDGIYSCEIPDSANVNQIIYIGVYTASSGTGE